MSAIIAPFGTCGGDQCDNTHVHDEAVVESKPIEAGRKRRERSPAPESNDSVGTDSAKRTRPGSLLVVSIPLDGTSIMAERVENIETVTIADLPSLSGSTQFQSLALTPATDFSKEVIVVKENNNAVHLFHMGVSPSDLWNGETRLCDIPSAMRTGVVGIGHRKLGAMQIFVDIYGNMLTLDVCPEDKIDDIKLKVWAKRGILVSRQRIIFRGKQLRDDYTVACYNITNEATVHLVLSMRGGMMHSSSGRADFMELAYPNQLHLEVVDLFSVFTSMDATIASLNLPPGFTFQYDGRDLHLGAKRVRDWFPELYQASGEEWEDRDSKLQVSWLTLSASRLVGPLPTDTTWQLVNVCDATGPAKMYVPAGATPAYIKMALAPRRLPRSAAARSEGGQFVRHKPQVDSVPI